MTLELTDREHDELVRLLKAARGDASTAIHHAMDHETRTSLRLEREVVDGLLKRLGEPVESIR